jgi:hypothetical protein
MRLWSWSVPTMNRRLLAIKDSLQMLSAAEFRV